MIEATTAPAQSLGKSCTFVLSRIPLVALLTLLLWVSTPANAGPYGAWPNPFTVKPNPYGAWPNPFAVKPNPYGARPNPFTVKPNPYGAWPNPFTVKPNPYGALPNPFDVTL